MALNLSGAPISTAAGPSGTLSHVTADASQEMSLRDPLASTHTRLSVWKRDSRAVHRAQLPGFSAFELVGGSHAPREAPLSPGGGTRPAQTGASSHPASWSTLSRAISRATCVSALQVPGLCLRSLRASRAHSGSPVIQTSCRWGQISEKHQGSQSFIPQGCKGLKKEGTQWFLGKPLACEGGHAVPLVPGRCLGDGYRDLGVKTTLARLHIFTCVVKEHGTIFYMSDSVSRNFC